MPKEAVNIKGTPQGLVILLDPNRNFEDIKSGLINKMESARGFFTGAKFTLYAGKQLVPEEQSELEAICKGYGLIPVPGAHWIKGQRPNARPPKSADQNHTSPGEHALLIKRTLRSGHRVTYRGHITILGDVHPGAEVVAGGSVVVLGTCSGFVHAGAGHNPEAFVLAAAMQRAQIRIMDQVLFETPDHLTGGPLIAKLGPDGVTLSRYDRIGASA
ncbi:septum site-determining protein MinC [Desulfallas sp. Bu1-1]|uniref:septum site-determining protein MinC n=1 Tax=Desulfallas sp. Bu1-1 TaxID=2787620 RepID=UPI0018A00BF3|nr:septum site-determining protein MinC [Desulfallas sp. Bu1-1]MBF7083081.1 septum site-determining protein MinC [Desulfallas sp. Bu1-1]